MPELPEVETVCIELKQNIIGRKIINAHNYINRLRIDFPKDFSNRLKKKYITDVKRKAKYILIYLGDLVLIIHLGMSGRLTYNKIKKTKPDKHDHAIIDLDGNTQLVYNDPRRFGLITIEDIDLVDDNRLFKNLGVEPLSNSFNCQYLSSILIYKNINIKTALMDNKIVVGIGNIYASESLFRAKINPSRISSSLTQNEIEKLVTSIKETLIDAINAGGSTLKDYVNLSGKSGSFQKEFNVYNRAKLPCLICEDPIVKTKHSNRATYYCSNCQQ